MSQEDEGLSAELTRDLTNQLGKCPEFKSGASLEAIFIDARIVHWKGSLPSADTLNDRVALVIDSLYRYTNTRGQNGLALLLRVLSDRTDRRDARKQALAELADRVEKETHSEPTSEAITCKPWQIIVGVLIGLALGAGGIGSVWMLWPKEKPVSPITAELPTLAGVHYKVNDYNPRLVDLRTASTDGIPVTEGQMLQLFDFTATLPEENTDSAVKIEVYADVEKIGSGELQRKGQVVQLQTLRIDKYPYDSGNYQHVWRVQPGWEVLKVVLVLSRDDETINETSTWIRLNPTGKSWLVDPPNLSFAAVVYTINDDPPLLLDLRPDADVGLGAQPGDVIELPEIWYRANAASNAQMSIHMYYVKAGNATSEPFQERTVASIANGINLFDVSSPLSSTIPADADALVLWLIRDGMVLDELVLPFQGSHNAGLLPLSEVAVSNPFITYYDFEGTNDGWSIINSAKFASDGVQESELSSSDASFPGSMKIESSTNYALTGESSLKVTTSVNEAGTFKSYLRRKGDFTANGITIYVMVPDLTGISMEYVQLCIPTAEWTCSYGTKLEAGEWTPLTTDLSRSDRHDVPLYKLALTEIAIQWRFTTESSASLDFYVDSGQVFYAGE